MMPRIVARIAGLFNTLVRGRALDRELDDELAGYLEHRIERLVEGGVAPAEARRRILAEEGGLEPIKEETRASRAGFGLATILQDVRYGARSMRRTPGFTLIACATLALGIGASVTMFTVMQSVLWKPLPYPQADRLVIIETDLGGVANTGAAPAEVLDLRERGRVFDGLATINGVDANIAFNGEMDRVAAVSASDNLLRVLGVNPALGRHLDARLDMGSESVTSVLVSHRLWQRHMGSDPSAVGRRITVNNMPLEVVGVLPEGFRLFLPASTGAVEDPDIWFPAEIPNSRDFRGYNIVGRLLPGRSVADAARDVDAVKAQLAADRATGAIYKSGSVVFRVSGLKDAMTERVGRGLRALGLAVAFVLLVSCVNVANLMLARASGRSREMAVRRALGAGRGRIVRQLLTESLLLSVLAGAAGLLLGHAGVQLLDWLRPTHLPRQSQVGIDLTVALFAVGVSVLAGVFFGVLPAMRFTASDAQALRAGRADSPSRRSRRTQRALVVAEVALSIVPLLAAGLMLRSFINLTHAPIGFNPAGIVTAKMPLSFRLFPFPNADARTRLHLSALEQLRQIPGVEAASAAGPMPFSPLQTSRRFGRAGEPAGARAIATQQAVMPGYLGIVGTRLLEGRDFTEADLAAKRAVAIVDRRLAESLWPRGALGQRMVLGAGRGVELEVIGVTEPVRVRQVRDESQPHIFVPYHVYPIEMTLVIKTSVPAAALAPAVKKTIEGLGTGRAVHDVKPMSDFVSASLAETRFTMLLLSGFAIAALVLASVGLYGTLAYLTSQRAREFGVRVALGASSRQILRLVAREGLVLTAMGAAAGLAGAILAARALQGLLYGVAPVDPGTLGAVIALVSILAVAACVKPAWSASRVDPTRALRAE